MCDEKKIEYITRKNLLYKTGVEYGDYCVNFVLGCAHSCLYCYAYKNFSRWNPQTTHAEWCKPKLVSNTLEILSREIPRLRNEIKSVHLSFTTDPFMVGYPEITAMSVAVIKMFNDAGIPCTTLTKGVLPIELACLSPQNEYGITLTSLDENFRSVMEPGAAPYMERLGSLRRLSELGCKTWISLEPYFTPNVIEQNLLQLLEAVSFVDKIIFGRANYYKPVSIFPNHREYYNLQSANFVEFCRKHGIAYHVKEGTVTAHPMCELVN